MDFRHDILPLKDKLYRLALRITCNQQEAEDVVQDTMLKVWNRREQWDQIESIEAFCMTICRNIALDHIKRKENKNASLEGMVIERSDQGMNPLELVQQQDSMDIVRQLVDALPERQRTCMQLRDFEGESYKDIAQILGITEDQVKINIFRARKSVRESFLKITK